LKLLPAHSKYLLFEQGIGSVILNFIIHGMIAWVGFRSMDFVPLWGLQSIALDTVITAFIVPFLTVLIVTPITHWYVRKGRMPYLEWSRVSHPVLARLPVSIFYRSIVVTVICMVLSCVVLVLGFMVPGINQLSFKAFFIFKIIFAGALAGILAPIVALCALGENKKGSNAECGTQNEECKKGD